MNNQRYYSIFVDYSYKANFWISVEVKSVQFSPQNEKACLVQQNVIHYR